EILWTVLIRGMVPAILGCGIGLVCIFLLVRYGQHAVAEMSSSDPGVLTVISALLLGVGFAACYFPAHRATRIDPMIALRVD
ncbi:MAG TPA: hypothetical protein VLI43_15325, partial [Gemmatimonadaceae bacterium]|nr:hypothetical protein [Gemmatimonadaceae bacterium]